MLVAVAVVQTVLAEAQEDQASAGPAVQPAVLTDQTHQTQILAAAAAELEV
jgi:hypothetical protein